MNSKNRHLGISNTLAIILVAIAMLAIGGTIYFISVRVASQQAVAPTAPESQPFARETECVPGSNECGRGKRCNSQGSCVEYCTGNSDCNLNFHCNNATHRCVANPTQGPGNDVVTTPTPITRETIINCGNSRCAFKNCHCTGGDACTGLECIADSFVTSCETNQGRSWCINQTGSGMTCCVAGYVCNNLGNGCVSAGGGGGGGGDGGARGRECPDLTWTPDTSTVCSTTTFTQTSNCSRTRTATGTKDCTTPTPSPTPTPTEAITLVPACTEIKFFVPTSNITSACTTTAECAIPNQPEGQFCNAGFCNTWTEVPAVQLSSKATVGSKVKISLTALNTNRVEVKINDGPYQPTTLNPSTGRFDYTLDIPAAGTFTVSSRYLIP